MDSFLRSTSIECQDVEIEFRTWYSCTWVARLSGSSKLSPEKLLSHLGKLPSEEDHFYVVNSLEWKVCSLKVLWDID